MAGQIVAGFHSRNDDWILRAKLRALSTFCDRICVLLDRSPQSESICREFPKCEVRHWQNTRNVPELNHDGPTCEEGAMRQATWDWCMESSPTWVVLGDTDELPTPDIADWLNIASHDVDVWYADWVHLVDGTLTAIAGPHDNPWAFTNTRTNKKGQVVRVRSGAQYRYRTEATRHVRIEPSPVSETATIHDARHKLGIPRMIHYKWARYDKWLASPQSQIEKYRDWKQQHEYRQIPYSWLWQWDADEYLKSLPEPIAVVGNGPLPIRCGDEIDAHPTVLRFNNWRTEGFEEQTGNKTTCWVTNCWEDVERRDWTGDVMAVVTHDEQRSRIRSWLGHYPQMYVPKTSWTEPCREIKRDNPSTGLTLLHRLAEIGKIVDAYGFSGLRGGHYWNANHQHNHSDESLALGRLMDRITLL